MTNPATATATAAEPQNVEASLRELNARIESLGGIVDALEPVVALLQQAPPLAAVLGDSFDEVMRTARDSGVDIEQGLLNGAGAALRFGAVMDTEKVQALEALLKSGCSTRRRSRSSAVSAAR
jgi:hypothetical protein